MGALEARARYCPTLPLGRLHVLRLTDRPPDSAGFRLFPFARRSATAAAITPATAAAGARTTRRATGTFLNGKILRIARDGSLPPDNPFLGLALPGFSPARRVPA